MRSFETSILRCFLQSRASNLHDHCLRHCNRSNSSHNGRQRVRRCGLCSSPASKTRRRTTCAGRCSAGRLLRQMDAILVRRCSRTDSRSRLSAPHRAAQSWPYPRILSSLDDHDRLHHHHPRTYQQPHRQDESASPLRLLASGPGALGQTPHHQSGSIDRRSRPSARRSVPRQSRLSDLAPLAFGLLVPLARARLRLPFLARAVRARMCTLAAITRRRSL